MGRGLARGSHASQSGLGLRPACKSGATPRPSTARYTQCVRAYLFILTSTVVFILLLLERGKGLTDPVWFGWGASCVGIVPAGAVPTGVDGSSERRDPILVGG